MGGRGGPAANYLVDEIQVQRGEEYITKEVAQHSLSLSLVYIIIKIQLKLFDQQLVQPLLLLLCPYKTWESYYYISLPFDV